MQFLVKCIRSFKWWTMGEFFHSTYLYSSDHIVAAKILYDKKGLLGLKQTHGALLYRWNTDSMEELLSRANVWLDCVSRYESHGSVAALTTVPTYSATDHLRTLYEYVDAKSITTMMEVYEQMHAYHRLYSKSIDPLIQKTMNKAQPIMDEMYAIIGLCRNDSLYT